jgi:hypothetical protein
MELPTVKALFVRWTISNWEQNVFQPVHQSPLTTSSVHDIAELSDSWKAASSHEAQEVPLGCISGPGSCIVRQRADGACDEIVWQGRACMPDSVAVALRRSIWLSRPRLPSLAADRERAMASIPLASHAQNVGEAQKAQASTNAIGKADGGKWQEKEDLVCNAQGRALSLSHTHTYTHTHKHTFWLDCPLCSKTNVALTLWLFCCRPGHSAKYVGCLERMRLAQRQEDRPASLLLCPVTDTQIER